MCLLERVIEWDQQRIRLETDTHRSTDNPLRSQDELKALHLCEYGAQAMAVHGALQAQQTGTTAPPGMLVALRSVAFHCERIDVLPGSLIIEAECLQSSASSQQYAFKISHEAELLCEGRAAVVLRGQEQEPQKGA
jgi:predicted hotdog family 3-hydroxylacyl-ACP dehydratase